VNDRAAATGHRPRSGTVRDRFMGNAVTVKLVSWLDARLVIADVVDRSARFPGGARG
jgi:hypothetical protein